MFNDKMMNDHFRDGFIFFGLALAVSGNLNKPTGLLLGIMNLSNLVIALASLLLALAYFILGYRKFNSQSIYNKTKNRLRK